MLTQRERDVLLLLGRGFTNRQIGKRLGIGVGSVRNVCTGLYRKLGVVNSHGAVVEGLREGYIDMEDLR